MERLRQNPDQLLRAIGSDASSEARGKLKIFFGYAAGVGKTYAMLRAAHQAKERGMDVVAGYIEPHARPQTAALLEGLERLPVRRIKYGAISLNEFDLDVALRRNPKILLVDELAHTNAEGSRHGKRYRDIEELLKAGIDVYTTVNVQHIESLNDTVASITGIMVRERIPDSVFDQADQVELVDIEPKDLLERLAGGEVYQEKQVQQAMTNFFTLDNLTALRELALRRCADRVNILTENTRIKKRGDYHTEEHILVCLSSSPSNARIIRTASRMASAFRGHFTALFVETPQYVGMEEEDKKRLQDHMRLAQQLGAVIETVYGEDVPYQIAEFSRLSSISKIVIGSSAVTRRHILGKPTLTERLISSAPNLDIYIIPDISAETVYQKQKRKTADTMLSLRNVGKTVLLLLAATLIGFIFFEAGFTEVNIITVYILGALITSVVTASRLCSLFASMVSVLVFNFFFTEPQFTFHVQSKEYPVTFIIMFITSFLTGSLAARLKKSAKQAARAAYRTKILFETNQLLQKGRNNDEILSATASQLTKLLKKDVVIYLSDGKELSVPNIYRTEESLLENLTTDNEKAVAHWVMKNNKHAGATTDTLASSKCMYLAIRINNQVYGVVGIAMADKPLDSFENSVLLSILGECGLALENIRNLQEKEQTAVLAKNEQLRANLLRAISHDLRTPLTSISGNASNLISDFSQMDDDTRMGIFTDIYDDSMWLINLVENMLAVTRLEEGYVRLNRSAELMEDVIAEALHHVNRKSKEHVIQVCNSEELLFAQMDAKLIVQVIINIVDNAIQYTRPGSIIQIKTEKKGNEIVVSVADNGPGIPDEQKPYIFDMFYSGANKIADSRRSLGLGLSLCKSIIAAHGGTISVSDNISGGYGMYISEGGDAQGTSFGRAGMEASGRGDARGISFGRAEMEALGRDDSQGAPSGYPVAHVREGNRNYLDSMQVGTVFTFTLPAGEIKPYEV